ncbi:MAG: RluA family pseudouridine synthase [Luteitalea sp.]|nr:RluA family pseudouridine synthase [Luteitalea sp.]
MRAAPSCVLVLGEGAAAGATTPGPAAARIVVVSDRRWRVPADGAGVRLDKFLAAPDRLASRSRAIAAIERGKVFLNETEATAADAARKLGAGDVLRFWDDRPGSSRRQSARAPRDGELTIVYEDDSLVVVNKPPGLLAVPLPRKSGAGSVQDALVGHFRSKGKRRPLVVHRIDRDTSGLVVFAKHLESQGRLRDQFRRREPERVYLAVVYGEPSPSRGTWRDLLVWDDRAVIQKETHPRDPKGKEAVSEYRILERFGDSSLLEVRLVTGRRNQIRLQARLHGHTLIGEQRYVYGPDLMRTIYFPRQALHAFRLGFVHPQSGQPLQFEASVPDDLLELLAFLRQ